MNPDPTAIPMELDPTQQRMRGYAIHGNTPFDVPYLSELAPNLWQGGCREGLVLPDFIDMVVSLYPWEKYTIENGAERVEIAMYDSTEQGFDQVEDIARIVHEARAEGKTVLVHCQAGLNRSSLVAARALMLDGMTADEAITMIRLKRSDACLCNPAFEKWLREEA